MKTNTTKTTKKLTPAQVKAKIAAHKPSWTCIVRDDINKSYFPSLARGRDKFTPGKSLAGALDRLCDADPEFTKSPLETETDNEGYVHHKLVGKGCTCFMANVGRQLMQAVLKQDKKFLHDFRTTWLGYGKGRKNPDARQWRKIGAWLESHQLNVEACQTQGEIVRLVQLNFPSVNERYLRKKLSAYGLPLSSPSKIRKH